MCWRGKRNAIRRIKGKRDIDTEHIKRQNARLVPARQDSLVMVWITDRMRFDIDETGKAGLQGDVDWFGSMDDSDWSFADSNRSA